MSITIKFERAMGYLKLNPKAGQSQEPKFKGTVGLAHFEDDDDEFVRQDAMAWSRKVGSEEYLDLHALGLEGRLRPCMKLNDSDPDFVGTLGRDKRLFVEARLHITDGAVRGLHVDFEDRGCSPFDNYLKTIDTDFI